MNVVLSGNVGTGTVRTEAGARASALLGNPDDIRESVQRFVDVGGTHFEMKFIYRTMEELESQLVLFAKEVLPAFSS